jgi:surface protein
MRNWHGNLSPFGKWHTAGIGITTDFVWTVATTTSSETFTIPCQNVGTFDAVVDWGDDSTSVITAYNDANLAHTYASAGDHQIKISGTFPNIYFNNGGDILKVKSVENLGVTGWMQLDDAFHGCLNMSSFVVGNSDTSLVTNIRQIFRGCSNLTTFDASGFDTSLVTDMQSMFIFCDNLTTINLSGFETSLVVSMSFMFRGCGNLTTLDISNFDTSLVETMRHMFRDCSSLTTLNVSSFDTSTVTDMSLMFFNNNVLTDIIGVEDFDIEALNDAGSLANFASGVTLPTARYDALLINWDAQNPFDGMSPNFGSSTYTAGGTAAAARANLISTDGWTITDGGTA